MTDEDEIYFQNSTHCFYCEKEFIDIVKVSNEHAHRKCVLDSIPRKPEIELQLNECINIINGKNFSKKQTEMKKILKNELRIKESIVNGY